MSLNVTQIIKKKRMKLIQRHDAQKELYIFICIYAG